MEKAGDRVLPCPYCGRPLVWIPLRWFGRGCFECETCGEFADFRDTSLTWRARFGAEPSRPRRVPKHSDRPRVLLVDDSAEHRDLYALMLESTAMVLTASRGEEALTIAAAEPLDVIVLDLLMPSMNGWEVRERLKAGPTTRSIPVILLTSLEKEDVAERARQAGMAAVLTKPCPVERLAVAIRDALPEPALVGDLAPVSVGVVPQRVPGTRRWARKRVPMSVLASVEQRQARLLNISYGGMCLAFEDPQIDIPQAFAVTVREDVTVRAEAVWMNRDAQRMWVCGAELCSASEEWRRFVDAIG